MSAIKALEAANAASVRVSIDGDDLVWEASTRPPDTVLSLLSRHKTDIVKLLRPLSDWRDRYDTVTRQWQDYGREVAAQRGFDAVLAEFGRRHPQEREPNICPACGEPLGKVTIALPNGARAHYEPGRICLEIGVAIFQRRAIAALASFGIVPPPGWAQ